MILTPRIVFAVNKKGVASAIIEKTADALTAADIQRFWPLVEEAIRKEVKSFFELKTFISILRTDATNLMTSKWILKWKFKGSEKIVKARLTVRGFEDMAAEILETYAGTASRLSQRLANSIVATTRWRICIADVGTAFLQGVTFEELAKMTGDPIREVSFMPPKGSELYVTDLDAELDFSKHVLKMLKPVYGLKDAPRCWRMRKDKALQEIHGKPVRMDPALCVV